jgi:hypothetical protein
MFRPAVFPRRYPSGPPILRRSLRHGQRAPLHRVVLHGTMSGGQPGRPLLYRRKPPPKPFGCWRHSFLGCARLEKRLARSPACRARCWQPGIEQTISVDGLKRASLSRGGWGVPDATGALAAVRRAPYRLNSRISHDLANSQSRRTVRGEIFRIFTISSSLSPPK